MNLLIGRRVAFMLAVAAMVLLSSNATVAILSSKGTSFVWFSFFCSIVTVAAILPFRLNRGFALAKKAFKEPWFVAAIFLKAVNDLAFYFAVIGSKSIEATIIVYLYPIFNVLVGAVLLEKRYARLSKKEWALVGLSFVSVVLLTPLSGLRELPAIMFAAAALSAIASVYVVLVQVTADRLELDSDREADLLGLLFIGSIVLHGVALILIALAPWRSISELARFPDISVAMVTGVLWIGLAVNIASEAFWLRASRVYQAISLKSIFYLSPVLGACYLAAFGIDDLNAVVVFCLTGVVASNFLIHQHHIDDVSYAAFLFGLIGGSVALEIAPIKPHLLSFALSSEAFQTQITFVSILTGFILFKAFEVYNRLWVVTRRLIDLTTSEALAVGGGSLFLEIGFDRLLADPDIFSWQIDENDPDKEALDRFVTLIKSEPIKDTYFDFFTARLVGISRPERFLMYLVCLTAIPSVLAQSVAAGSGAFVAAFSTGLFLFLPVLVDDQIAFRSGRPLVGITLRRALALKVSTSAASQIDPQMQARHVYRQNSAYFSAITFCLTLVVFSASWWLLET